MSYNTRHFNPHAPGPLGDETPDFGTFSPLQAKGPAIYTFPDTTHQVSTAGSSTTVTFEFAADAITCGYDATNPILGATIITGAINQASVTRVITSWTNSMTAVVDLACTLAANTELTSVQKPRFSIPDLSTPPVLKIASLANNTLFINAVAIRLHNGATWTEISNTDADGGYLNVVNSTDSDRFSANFAYLTGWMSANFDVDRESTGAFSGTVHATAISAAADRARMWVKDWDGVAGAGSWHMVNEQGESGPIAFDYRHKYYWCEDFDDEAAGVQFEAGLQADFWTTAGTNYAAGNVTYLGGVGGTLKALCANADNDSVTIIGLPIFNTSQNPILEARIKIDVKETAAFLVGFAGAASAAIDTYPDNCFLVGINSDNTHTFGATQVVAFSNDDAAGVDYDDMGVAIVSDTFIKIKIDLTDTEQPRVWINDTEVAAGSISGTVKDATALCPYVAVQNLAGGAIQRFVTWDYTKGWQDRG